MSAPHPDPAVRVAAREAGLRRLRRLNRGLVLLAVALCAGFSAVAAAALPGGSRAPRRTVVATRPTTVLRGPMAPDVSAGAAPPAATSAPPPAAAPVDQGVPPPVTAQS